MVIPPLGGTVRGFRWRILKGWPQVHIHALLTYFAYLQPLKSYSTFSFWLGFPYCQPNLWGFRGKWPPKSQNFEKHLLRGHFLASNRVFWLLCYRAWKSVHGYGLYAWLGKKETKIIKARDPDISPIRGGATADTIATKVGKIGRAHVWTPVTR